MRLHLPDPPRKKKHTPTTTKQSENSTLGNNCKNYIEKQKLQEISLESKVVITQLFSEVITFLILLVNVIAANDR